MATHDDIRNAALQHLDRQEEDNREKRQRSEAYRKAKEAEYMKINAEAEKAKVEAERLEGEKARIKVEFEKVFWADIEVKNVVQKNASKIAERRHKLEGEYADVHDEELLKPLVLQDIEAPEPLPTSRPSGKKGIAIKSRSSSKKSQPEQDDQQYKPHRKQPSAAIGAEEAGRTRRLRSDVSDKQTSDGPSAVEDGDVEQMEEADDGEGPDPGERASSVETVLSHITVARKHSKGTTPAADDMELPSLPFDQQLDQQLEHPGDVDSDEEQRRFEDAMQSINEPFPYTLAGLSDAPTQQGNLEDLPVEERAASPASSIASSSSSGLFVSERPRRRSSTPRAYREPSIVMSNGGQLDPELLLLRQHEVFDEDGHPNSMLPPELSTLRASSVEDSLFGEPLSEMDIDQDPAQLPTPDPSGIHAHSREPSERQQSNEPGVSNSANSLFVPEDPPMEEQSGERLGKRHSADASPEEHQEEPAKKKPVKRKSFLEKVLSRGR